MIQTGANFDKYRDIQEVDQFGFIDLVKSFQNGYVEGNSDIKAEAFNEIEDPASIIGKPSDVFEALRMQDTVIESVKSASAKKSEPSSEN